MSSRLRQTSRAAAEAHAERTAQLLRIPEAAKRLGIGKSTLYELMANGSIDYVRIAADRRISEAAISEFVARNTVARGAL